MARRPLTLVELIERYGGDKAEDKCRALLEELRWPDGIECPRCAGTTISRIHKRRQFDCDSCRYQFSVKAGTVFHDSHLPLWKWFLATYLIVESKKGISANQLKRSLGVNYRTAWYLSHRIRHAMGEGEEGKLTGTVEVDETWVGRAKGIGSGGYHKHQTMIVGAVQRGGPARLRVGDKPTKEELHGFIREHVADDAEAIYTDRARGYQGIGDHNPRHETVNHYKDEWVRGDVHTQTVESVWSLFKRQVIGSHHHLSVKHLPAYLDEVEWRFNNRDNPYLFRLTLTALITGSTLTYRTLVDGAPHASGSG